MDAAGLARHYSRFRVTERVLLTGHSHQAWPDVAFEAQAQAWLDAAEHLDDKWSLAFEAADRVRAGYRRLLDDPDGHVALGQNTHELVTRFLSALPLRDRPRLVTTDGEFHTVRRQLERLREEGIEVASVAAGGEDGRTVAERVAEAVDGRTAAVLVSSVLFRDARIVDGLDEVARVCALAGAELLVDAYHSLAAVPFSVRKMGIAEAFVVGGGYKYCQLGEGAAFLRFPANCTLRPVLTGWFGEFGALAETPPAPESAASRTLMRNRRQEVRRAPESDEIPHARESSVPPTAPEAGRGVAPHSSSACRPGVPATTYAEGHLRFGGATYEPASHYRAAAVFAFFREQGLAADKLRAASLTQIRRLAGAVDALDLDPAILARDHSIPLERKGGFLALSSPRAAALVRALHARGVHADHRGAVLRLGPAPYVTNQQIDDAAAAVGEAARTLDSR